MTLRDPKNPALWLDGTPRSQGHAFDTGYVVGSRLDWRREQIHANAKQRTTKVVERRRASGETGLNTVKPSCISASLQRQANQREVSAKRVEERRAAGIKAGTIYGLSKKADRRREGGA